MSIEAGGGRFIAADSEPDLAQLIYAVGVQMVINTVLTMQHFCQEIEGSLRITLEGPTLGDRIKESFAAAKVPLSAAGRGYAALRAIVDIRDAIEHPKSRNVFNSHPTEWDRVPLSWFLTERALESFACWHDWFAIVVQTWQKHPVHAPRTVTLTVERGMKTMRPSKKPPKDDA